MTIDIQVQLESETCCACGILFAMPADYQQQRRRKHDEFYCPSGHGQHYTQKTEAERLREQLERERDAAADTRRQLAAECRAHSATKGQITRLKKRVAVGVCPACTRTFSNLARHMHSKHPDFTGAQD